MDGWSQTGVFQLSLLSLLEECTIWCFCRRSNRRRLAWTGLLGYLHSSTDSSGLGLQDRRVTAGMRVTARPRQPPPLLFLRRRPSTAMSFHLAAPSDSDASSGSDLDDLPFPAPLAADAFQTPAGGDGSEETFSPTAFLASLRNRHQTLEDLRTELRTRARDLERELVDLVNRDYADFAGLGPSVRGGEAKVADLQVGMLAFRRDVEGVAAAVERVQSEVDREMKEKAEIRRQKVRCVADVWGGEGG